MSDATRILVAGAAGSLGRHVLRELLHRRHGARALVHRRDLPSWVDDRVEICRGDALDASVARRVCDRCDVVFSCLGASVSPGMRAGRRSYDRIDWPANRNLIEAAEQAGVRRFVYVSVAGHDELGHLRYVGAHEDVVRRLEESGLEHAVVRPPGFFSAFNEVFDLARRGWAPIIGDGAARTNPIHDADLAVICVDAIEGQDRELLAGGPEILTRRRIAELALEALGRSPRVRQIPPAVVRALGRAMRPMNPRVADIVAFYAAVSVRDLVVPARGDRTLSEHFRGLAR